MKIFMKCEIMESYKLFKQHKRTRIEDIRYCEHRVVRVQ